MNEYFASKKATIFWKNKCGNRREKCGCHNIKQAIIPRQTSAQIQFTNKDLINLILPIFAERLLSVMIGVVDTLMISYAGEVAVAGVSLVNQLNNVFILILGAVATGGAVIASQYIGKGNRSEVVTAASQLLLFAIIFSSIMTVFLITFGSMLLYKLFGGTEADVMLTANTYLKLSALTFPLLAISDCGSALFRSMQKSRTILYISIVMNVINVVGNSIGIFVFNAGVTGIAVSSIISRLFSTAMTLALLFRKQNIVHIRIKEMFKWDGKMLKRILHIAIPNGIETGLFQISKVAVLGIVALFGTMQIAAYAIAQNLWSITTLFCSSLSYAFVTVIGQCMGAENTDEAESYIKKLLRITYIGSAIWSILVIAFTPSILMLYSLSRETIQLVMVLVIMLTVFNILLCPLDFALPSGLRAAGDIKYTMAVSGLATVLCRVFFALLFGVWLNTGIIGVAAAIVCDRIIKAVLIFIRYRSGVWKQYRVI